MSHQSKLRIYYGPEDTRGVALTSVEGAAGKVEVQLEDLLETVGDAVRKHRTWVKDFRQEKVAVSTDLYEVIAAYQQLKRSA